MKKICLLLAAIALTAQFATAQNEALNGFIEKYRQDKAFTFAYLSKDLFEVVSKTRVEDQDWKKLHNVVKNIGSLRILAADSIQTGRSLFKEALALVPTDEVDELLTVRDGTDDVRIWVKEEDAVVSNLILLVGSPDEFVLVCFTGNLELGNLSELARLFDAEEAQSLARAAAAVAPEFGISPNPSNGEFTLRYADEQDQPRRLSIADQNGRVVLTQDLSGAATQHIEVRDLPAGLYWVQLETVNGKVGVKQLQVVK